MVILSYLKKFNYLTYVFILSITFWFILVFLQISHWVKSEIISNSSAKIEFLIHFATIIGFFKLYAKTNLEDRLVLKWLLLANIFLFLNDLSFYFAVYFKENYILSNSFFIFFIGYLPYLIWISSIIIFLSKILVQYVFGLFKFSRAYPVFIIINLSMVFLFFSSINYAFNYFSWEIISHIISFMSESIIFDFSILCLIYSENKGLSLFLFGLITLVSGDFFINYSFISQTKNLLNYGELLWFLGLILIFFGVCLIHEIKKYSMKSWFSKTNTIKNRLALWSFGTSIFSFVLFFTLAYFFSNIDKKLFLFLPFFIMMYSVIVVILSIYMGKRFEEPFKKLMTNVEALMSKDSNKELDENFSTQEFIFLQKFIVASFEIKDQKDRAQQVLISVTAQLAHDIRSPLAAINTAISDVSSVPENKRIIIRNAAQRINDIANNVLLESKNNSFDSKSTITDKNNHPELIFVALDNIISEKRYEYNKTNIQITLNGSGLSYNCFSNINLGAFKRIISNLINNSIEALPSNGSIVITMLCSDNHVEIIIADNGCGIPASILPKITEQGFSFNKKNGSGLGLYSTKKYLEEINGSMFIHSDECVGTKININLVRSNPPIWFCETINIAHNSLVVVLDDDPSIHDAWNERFSNITTIKIINFYTFSEILHYKFQPYSPILYLVDYEFSEHITSGLDLIEKLNISDKSILVTSRFEDIYIRNRCEKIGVNIIPKPYVPYIKINEIPKYSHKKRVVFIDDDDMMRMTWTFAAEEAGITITTFSSCEGFVNELSHYNKNTVIYIDSDLGLVTKGEIYAKYLFDKGFTEIYLTTGYSKNHFHYMPWIKNIIGKEPPFQLT